MAKMMMGQITHARERVAQIKRNLIGEAPDARISFDIEDIATSLEDGTLVFTGPQLQKVVSDWAIACRGKASYHCPNLQNILRDAAYPLERAADKNRYDAEQAKYEARVKAANAEATKVEDAIVLGDNKAALDALIAFAAFRLS